MQIVYDAIRRTLELANSKDSEVSPTHFARPFGSYIKEFKGLEDEAGRYAFLYLQVEWTEITEEALKNGTGIAICRYFKATIPEELTGIASFQMLSECSEEELSKGRWQKGHHGDYEFVIPGNGVPTSELNIVLGPLEGQEHLVVWTGIVGRLTPRIRPEDVTIKFV